MKRLVPILLFLLLLTGCAGQQAELTAPAAAEAVGILGEQVEWLKYPRFKLLDDTVSDDGVLHTVMPTSGGSMVQFGRNLLIHQQQWGQDNSSTLTLTLLSILDGSVLAEYETKVIDMVTPQIVDDCIILCDSGSGDIIWLDSKLQPTRQEHFEPDGRSWYVSPDFTRLYQLDWLEGFSAVDMATGASTSLTEDFSDLFFNSSAPDMITVDYVDPDDQMRYSARFDLDSGSFVTVPFDRSVSDLQYRDGLWLASEYADGTTYFVGSDEAPTVLTVPSGGLFQLTNHDGQLIFSDFDGNLSLYDSQGRLLSQGKLKLGEEEYLMQTFLWSDPYQGYFFRITTPNGEKLMFWDVNVPCEGSDLPSTTFEDYLTPDPGTAVDSALYERAARLSEEYGVVIRIADQCETVFESFESPNFTDEYWISQGLDELEQALASYPDGFFRQLRFDRVRHVEIQLVSPLVATDDQWKTASYSAFATKDSGRYLVVIDTYQASEFNFYHEFSHIIDSRLNWDAQCRPDSQYSEEQWRVFSPDSAEYSFTYTDWPDIYTDDLTVYFVDSYSRTYPTEDRARIMEYAMMGWLDDLETQAGIRKKLTYYAACIRDCFDTQGWPETTLWEEPLQ